MVAVIAVATISPSAIRTRRPSDVKRRFAMTRQRGGPSNPRTIPPPSAQPLTQHHGAPRRAPSARRYPRRDEMRRDAVTPTIARIIANTENAFQHHRRKRSAASTTDNRSAIVCTATDRKRDSACNSLRIMSGDADLPSPATLPRRDQAIRTSRRQLSIRRFCSPHPARYLPSPCSRVLPMASPLGRALGELRR
jgi:hypothetical protein